MSKASTFLRTIIGGLKSNTMQAGGLFLTIWTAVFNSDYLKDLIAQNPEYAAILGGVNALVMLLLRGKTAKPLSER